MKFKSITSLLLIGAFLAGCSGTTPSESAKTSTSASTSASTTTSESASTTTSESTSESAMTTELAPVELSWYFVGGFPQEDQDLVFDEFNVALKEKINATVKFNGISWGEYEKKIQVIIASGEAYDICFTSNWMNNYVLNASKGAFAPLDDLLVQYAPKTYAQVPKDFWEATKVKGKIYGVVNEQIAARAATYGVITELATKYNFDVNSVAKNDIRGYEPFLTAAVKDNPKAYFNSDFDNPSYFKQDFIAGWNIPGAIYVDDAGTKVFNQYESPEMMAYADVLRDFNSKGLMNSEERISTTIASNEEVRNMKMVAKMDGAYKPGVEVQEFMNHGVQVTDIAGAEAVLTTSGITATLQAISRGSKNPERAMMLLELMNTDQYFYNLLNYGIKDKHFSLDAEGFMIKEGTDAEKYAPGVPWMFASNYMAYVSKGMPKDVWEQTKKMNNDAKRSPLLGFNFDIDPVKGEIGQCTTIIDEYNKSILYGIATKEKYAEFLTKLKEAGSDKIIAEMQTQVDAWKASK